MPSPLHLTDQNLASVISTSPALVVDFYGASCGPCKQIAPFIEKLAAEAKDFHVAKVDVAHAPQATRALGIQSTPTLLIFQGGREVARLVGANNIIFRLKQMLR